MLLRYRRFQGVAVSFLRLHMICSTQNYILSFRIEDDPEHRKLGMKINPYLFVEGLFQEIDHFRSFSHIMVSLHCFQSAFELYLMSLVCRALRQYWKAEVVL